MTDGCVHLLYNNSCKFHQLAAGQPLSEQPVRSGKAGGTGRPTEHKSHLPGHCPPAKLSRLLCRTSFHYDSSLVKTVCTVERADYPTCRQLQAMSYSLTEFATRHPKTILHMECIHTNRTRNRVQYQPYEN
jgi:hypothetical protein